MSLLRPNTLKVERQGTAGESNAGDPIPAAPSTIIQNLPAFVDSIPAQARLTYTRQGGPIVQQTHTAYIDGASAGGAAAGASVNVTIGGATYAFVVSPNGANAYADIAPEDRVTDERGVVYLVLAVVYYYGIKPHIQVHLAEGQAWA